MKKHEIIFGPILSRRLGRSLGIDPVMRNICCQDCVYCEAGRTEILTVKRDHYVPADEVIAQLDKVLQSSPELDYVTFSGLGEPTLNAGIGQIARFVKEKYPEYPLCLLTNGMLLGDPLLLQEIACVDLVIPSLDASNAEEFTRVNRPAPEIDFQTFIAGLTEFTHQFKGKVWLELFIVPGVNDSEENARELLRRLKGLPAHFNLIPLNHVEESPLKPSSRAAVARFQKILEDGGITATVRRTLGSDIDASCGQLRRKYTKGN